jgi:hypothetical protein
VLTAATALCTNSPVLECECVCSGVCGGGVCGGDGGGGGGGVRK